MWKDEPARRVLEQQALAAVEAKLQDTSSVQGVALILQEVQNLQRMQATHYDQAREQAEPAGALLNQALEALETAEAMSGAGRLGFGLQTAADPPSPARGPEAPSPQSSALSSV